MLKTLRHKNPGATTAPGSRQTAPTISLLALTVWFALVAGLGEVLVRIGPPGQRFVHLMSTYPQLLGLAPLGELVFMLPITFVLLLLALRWPALRSLRVATFIIGFLPVVSLIFSPNLHIIAVWLLTAGIALQIARLAGRYPTGFRRIVYSTLPPLLAVALLAPIAGIYRDRAAEQKGLAALPPARADAPNILFIILDTVRALNLSVYGYERETTPNLERLFKEGVRFDWAITTAPWTLPSHASMMTGRFPTEHRADFGSPLDGTYPTLAEALRERGYATIGSVANYGYAGIGVGIARGFLHYNDAPYTVGFAIDRVRMLDYLWKNTMVRRLIGNYESAGRKDANDVERGLLNWIDRNERRPFFAFLNYTDAHAPYLPPAPYDLAFSKDGRNRVPLMRLELFKKGSWTPEQLAREEAAYDGAIAYLDARLGWLFEELRKRNQFDNTIVIVSSDHGEAFSEHRKIIGHGRALYSELVHVPLLLRWPGKIPAGVSVSQPTSLRNVPATVLDLVGIENGGRFPGVSFARYWSGVEATATAEPELILSEFRANAQRPYVRSLVVDEHHYIVYGNGREELYHLTRDPKETTDLASTAEAKPVLEKARATVRSAVAAMTAGQPRGSAPTRK